MFTAFIVEEVGIIRDKSPRVRHFVFRLTAAARLWPGALRPATAGAANGGCLTAEEAFPMGHTHPRSRNP